ncbi:uncharacterized protein LOC144146989 [Haemaphysalis longicornis]
MATLWLLWGLLGTSLAAPLSGHADQSGIIGRRELRRPALFYEAQHLGHGTTSRQPGVIFKTLSNFGGRRRLVAPAGSVEAATVGVSGTEGGSDDAITSLINRFGGVINQKRRLGDDDVVTEGSDELIARPSGPKLSSGSDGKLPGSDEGEAWRPMYGGGYRKEPELQSNYHVLLSEPDFGTPGSLKDSYSDVIKTGADLPQAPTAGNEPKAVTQTDKASGEEKKNPADCKDKNTQKDFPTGSGDNILEVKTETSPGSAVSATTETAEGQQGIGGNDAVVTTKPEPEEDDEEYDDDDYEDDEEQSEFGDLEKNNQTTAPAPDQETTVKPPESNGRGPTGVGQHGDNAAGSQLEEEPSPQKVTDSSAIAQLDTVTGASLADNPDNLNRVTGSFPEDDQTQPTVPSTTLSGELPGTAILQDKSNPPTSFGTVSPQLPESLSPSEPEFSTSDPGVTGSNTESSTFPTGQEAGDTVVQSAKAEYSAERAPDGILRVKVGESGGVTSVDGSTTTIGVDVRQNEQETSAQQETAPAVGDSVVVEPRSGSSDSSFTSPVPTSFKDGTPESATAERQSSLADGIAAGPTGSTIVYSSETAKNPPPPTPVTPPTNPTNGRKPGRGDVTMNGVSREAAEEEILNFFKEHGRQQDTSLQPHSSSVLKVSGADTIATKDTLGSEGVTVAAESPKVKSQSPISPQGQNVNYRSPNVNTELPSSGVVNQRYPIGTQFNFPAASPEDKAILGLPGRTYGRGTLTVSGFPNYGIPTPTGVIYPPDASAGHFLSERVFGQGTLPASSAGFVAESALAAAPANMSENTPTAAGTTLANGSNENNQSKAENNTAAVDELIRTSNDVQTYKAASSLEQPAGMGEGTEHNIEDGASTSFFAGSDSVSTAKDKNLAVDNLEMAVNGGLGRTESQENRNKVADEPIDVSGILTTASDNDSSSGLAKQSTTITDSTKALVVEDASHGMPIDVSGIATTSETTTDDASVPSTGSHKGVDVGKPDGDSATKTNEQPSPGVEENTKTNEDCKDQDMTGDSGSSPHGKPVVFGAIPLSVTDQAPTGGAKELIETPQEQTGVSSSNGSDSMQREIPAIQSDQPPSVSGTHVSLATNPANNQETQVITGSEVQPQRQLEQSEVGFVVGTKLDVSDRDRAPPSTTTGPSITTSAVSSPDDGATPTDFVQSSTPATTSETATPPAATMVDQKDDRELGGVDMPEAPGNNSTVPGEKSIVVVLSQMFNDTNASENVSTSSHETSNPPDPKHTPLPTSSVRISSVGHSTATLPALGYATVKEIQIASQQTLPSKEGNVLPPATSQSGYADQLDSRSPKRSEVVDVSSNQNSGSEFVLAGDEGKHTTTQSPVPRTEPNLTVSTGTSLGVSEQQPEMASPDTPLSQGSMQQVPETSTSSSPPTTQTAIIQDGNSEAPKNFVGETAVTEQSPTEITTPLQGTVTNLTPKFVSAHGATGQVSTDSTPLTKASTTDTPTQYVNEADVTPPSLTETTAPGPKLSTEVPPSITVTNGLTQAASFESTTGPPLSPETPSVFGGTKDTVPVVENTGTTETFSVLSTDVLTSTLSPGAATDENLKEPTTPTSREQATEVILPITSTPIPPEAPTSSAIPTENASVDLVPTTEKPNAATLISDTTSQRVNLGVTSHPNVADTTIASSTPPPPPYVKPPQISTLHVPKRPLFPLRRPSSFVTTPRNVKPEDNRNEDDQAKPPATSTAPPVESQKDDNTAALPGREKVVAGVRRQGAQSRRPHFPRPTSGNRVAGPGDRTGGRKTGRRRKPGRRPGHRRTTTVMPPQSEAPPTTPSSVSEDTAPGYHLTSPSFGARIGARVTETSFRRTQTAQKSPIPFEPVPLNREHSRPPHTRRTKRPKVPHTTQTAATEDNNVRYSSYNTHNFVGTRTPAVAEITYEPTREAYVTNVAPASTTYRTKSALVAEVTLPSTQETDGKVFSSVEYGEPLSDEPQLPSPRHSNEDAPVNPLPSSGEQNSPLPTFDEQQLLQDHGVRLTSQITEEELDTTKALVANSGGPKNEENEQNDRFESDQTKQPPTSSDEGTPPFSTMAPSTPYGTKLNVAITSPGDVSTGSEEIVPESVDAEHEGTGTVVSDEVSSDSGKSVSEGNDEEVQNAVTPTKKFYPGRYRPQHTTTYATTEAPTEATTRLATNAPTNEPTTRPALTEEPFPTTPELDISRVQTTTQKPAQSATVPTTKAPLFPPLPEPPTNPVAVFLVPSDQAQNEGAERDQLQTVAPAEKQAIQTVTTTRPATAVTTQRTESPQLSLNKQTAVDLPPSFLISGPARQPTAPAQGTNIPAVPLTQYAPNIQRPATVATSESDGAAATGTKGSVNKQDDAKGFAPAGATPNQSPYANERPPPGSINSGKLEASADNTPQRPDALPALQPPAVQSHTARPPLQPNASTLQPPQKQPDVFTSQSAATIPPTPTQTTSPATNPPLVATGRPRLPPAYGPQPAFLQPLGIQVRQPSVIGGQSQPPAAPAQPQQYLQSLGLQVANYPSAKAQKPSLPQNAQTSGVYVQPLGLQLTEAPKPGSSLTGSSPGLGAGLPSTALEGQQQQRLPAGVRPGANSQYLLPLGLQVPYSPPQQRQPAGTSPGRLPSKPPGPRPQQGSAPAPPKGPKYSVVSSPPRPSVAAQPVGRIPSSGVNKPGTSVFLAPQVAVPQGNTRVPGTNRVVSSGLATKYPASSQNDRKPPSAPFRPGHGQGVGSPSRAQQPRPYGAPQAQPGQRPHIGQARTRIFFSPPTPVKQDGAKNPRLPVSPFFLSIQHDQVIQEDAALPQIGNSLLQKQRVPADVLLPLQNKAVQPNGRPAAARTNAGYDPLLQVPQTPKPARVQPQPPFAVGNVATGYKPSSPPSYAVPSLPQGVVRQVILSPATGPIPYQPQTIASANQKTRQQETHGVYNVRAYVPIASARLPGSPGLTATSYVPATQNGQKIKVTSVSRPSYSPTGYVAVQNGARGAVQARNARPSGVPPSARQPGAATLRQPSPATGGPRVAQAIPNRPAFIPQVLVQVPQQVYQVGSGAPQQTHQGRTYVSQVPTQQTYQGGQRASLGYQGPVVYAAPPGAPVSVAYQPTSAAVIGQIRQSLPPQLQAIYSVPQGYRVVQGSGAQGATRTSAGRPGQTVYTTGGSPAVYQALPPGVAAQNYARSAQSGQPVALVGRSPVYAYQSPVYTYRASSPQRGKRGATNQSRPPAVVGIR